MNHAHIHETLRSKRPPDLSDEQWAHIVEILISIIEDTMVALSAMETQVTNAEIALKAKDATIAQDKADHDALTAQLADAVKALAAAQAAAVGMVAEADVAALKDKIDALTARLAVLTPAV